MRIDYCEQHGHSAYLKLQPDRGCWKEGMDGNPCRMVPMRLIPDNAETGETPIVDNEGADFDD